MTTTKTMIQTSLSGGSKMRSVNSLVSRFSLPGWSPMYRMIGAKRQGQLTTYSNSLTNNDWDATLQWWRRQLLRRANARCASIVTLNGTLLQWSDELRYLGVHVVRSSRFNISLDRPRRSFYRAANSVFGKVGRVASEEVTIQFFNSKCLPVLLYGLEACSLSKSDLCSIDFAFNRFFYEII